MPTGRKRAAARNSRSKRKQPKLPEGDFNTSISVEEQESKLQNYVDDYQLQVKAKLDKMKKYIQTSKGVIRNCYRNAVLQIVKSVRNMITEEFYRMGGTVDAVISAQVHAGITGLVSSSTPAFDGLTNCRQPLTNLSNNIDVVGLHISVDQLSAMTSQAASNVKTAGKSTRKRKQVTGDKPPVPQTGTRSSLRLRAKESSINNNEVTPMANVSTVSVLNAATFITPKFDPRLPIPSQSMREPKAGERIISMSGSPLANPVGPGCGSAALIIPLTGGKTMQLSVGDKSSVNNEGMDVTNDSVAQQNIKLLQEKLSQLLKVPKDMK